MNSSTGQRFTLQEGLCIAFCATFVVIARAALRLHLNIPGHAMFFTIFFIMLGRGCVARFGAATLVGLVAGFVCMLLGMGKGGPLMILKFALPGLVVDLAAAFHPALFSSLLWSVVTGALASATRFGTVALVDGLMGMDKTVVLQHALLSASFSMLFGALGAAMVPAVVRRLEVSGLIAR
ncbi:conserved membrane hypothetical protein [uncultured Desulfatiglans sp.]|uniref:Uncharacterized protein n=1 Tax=Uncultured Desulfatiglans sp. TaxID=1748965 RepID=A0A653AFU5_UNCDX|nr:conserved membrane hypothetical protein [uncultured Desulfatiglans sp.]